MRCLVLTAGYGEGHNTAARNLAAGLRSCLGEGHGAVEVCDLFPEAYGLFDRFAKQAYRTAINRTPKVWQVFYEWLDGGFTPDPHGFFAPLVESIAAKIEAFDPAIIATTYPVYNSFLPFLKKRMGRRFLHATVVTDSISINSVWTEAPCDLWLAPNEPTVRALVRKGAPAERIRDTGFPVPLVFCQPPETPRPDPTQRKKILLMIGTGRQEGVETARKLLGRSDVELTVTIGLSKALERAFGPMKNQFGDRIQLVGWTDRIPQLLQEHHLLIGKAGGASTQEAIAARCPMIVSQIVPGQEEGNYELLRRADAGLLATTPDAVDDAVREIFAEGAKRWRDLEANISKISRPDGALASARVLIQSAGL